MASTKRKHSAELSEQAVHENPKKLKKSKLSVTKSITSKDDRISVKSDKIRKKKFAPKAPSSPADLDESDTTESENGFYGFSAKETSNNQLGEEESVDGNGGEGEGEGVGVVVDRAAGKKLRSNPKSKGMKQNMKVAATNGATDGSCKSSTIQP